jgi:hypothetical protein
MVPVLGGETPLLYAYDDGKPRRRCLPFPSPTPTCLSKQHSDPGRQHRGVARSGIDGEPYHAGRAGTRITSEAHAGAVRGS